MNNLSSLRRDHDRMSRTSESSDNFARVGIVSVSIGREAKHRLILHSFPVPLSEWEKEEGREMGNQLRLAQLYLTAAETVHTEGRSYSQCLSASDLSPTPSAETAARN